MDSERFRENPSENRLALAATNCLELDCGDPRRPTFANWTPPSSLLRHPAISFSRHSSLYPVERAESLQGMRFRRKASQAAWVRLRAPSLICAFFRWLRIVS